MPASPKRESQMGKGHYLTMNLLEVAQMQGARRAEMLFLQSRPQVMTLNRQGWLEKWNGRGRSKRCFCRVNNKK